jgi:predicted oxidoreductase
MKSYHIPNTDRNISRIAYGCMKIGGTWDHAPITAEIQESASACISAALESGIDFFDHADIYTCGKSEEVFGHFLKGEPGLREKITLQSKCGIRFPNDALLSGEPPRYDFSYDHIIRSVEGILRRLQTDYLDILLLHRPDPLVEPAEVAQAFDELHDSGKVLHFGVSNHTAGQMDLLAKHVRQPLIINQLQFSLIQPALVVEGFSANQINAVSALATGILDYCQKNDILVQAWSPVGGGYILKPDRQKESPFKETADLISTLAKAKNTTPEGILLAWILRHPAGIQPIIGTTKPERVVISAEADDVSLSREEWYQLLAVSRGKNVP